MPQFVLLLTEREGRPNRSRDVLSRYLPEAQIIEVHALQEVPVQLPAPAVELIWIDRLGSGDGLTLMLEARKLGFRAPVVIVHMSTETAARVEEQRDRAGDVLLCQLDELAERAPRILEILGLRGGAR